ncbi:Uncharacterised protein [Buttiauxella agrestis]|uniref:Uncharacterized protein n=1 Tax=Buttiauxella agrestis TaxID=82977 RepID=A0A381KNB2_9ENTR|nr:hypothetical protein [Buttiauxella agrestis]SUY92850.1 Uncharacterised protein [Buttiauxella agrestis]
MEYKKLQVAGCDLFNLLAQMNYTESDICGVKLLRTGKNKRTDIEILASQITREVVIALSLMNVPSLNEDRYVIVVQRQEGLIRNKAASKDNRTLFHETHIQRDFIPVSKATTAEMKMVNKRLKDMASQRMRVGGVFGYDFVS